MKKAFMFTSLFLLLLASCSDSKKRDSSNESFSNDDFFTKAEGSTGVNVDRTDAMGEQVQRIYDEILPQYKKNISPDRSSLWQKYCSEEFIELDRKAEKLAKALNDECTPYDCDEWIFAQDYDESLAAKVVESKYLSDENGVVVVELTNFSKPNNLRLAMKRENNVWKVDDIQSEIDGKNYSIKEIIKDYLAK